MTINDNFGDLITFGVDGSVQGIKADVTMSNRQATIVVDDSADPTPLEPVIGAGSITNLLPNGRLLPFPDGEDENLTLDTGPGDGRSSTS